ncbi:MAG: DNA polymerase III subunit beta [Candidatus Binatia bacterium]
MEFTIQRTELLAGLYLTQGIVERRTTIPILGNVLIESDGERVILSATDQEIAVRRQCIAAVKKKGTLTANARKLYEMVREIPDGDVRIRQQDNNWIEVVAGRSRFRLVGLDAREFPAMAEAPAGALGIRIAADVLTEMLEYTIFAVSGDETRVNLNGIHVERAPDGRLRMVATDGHRLAMITRTAESVELAKGITIPRKAVLELRKMLEGGDEGVEIGVAGGVAYAVRGRVQMAMRLVEGEFPDYNQVVPPKSQRHAVLDAAALHAALRRVSVVSSERTRGVKLQFDAAKLELTTINPDVGEAAEEIEVEYDGDPLSIGFNARYLLDVLSVLPADRRVEIGLTDEVSPGAIRAVDDADYRYIVMPMRL